MTGFTGTYAAQQADLSGTTAKGARLAQGGLLAHDGGSPLNVRLGVLVDDLTAVVSGAGDMSYNIRAAAFACAYSEANGPTVSANDAVVNASTTAAPGSNSRIDLIWVRQNLLTADGGSGTVNTLEFGVTQGATAASPTVPATPTGALALMTVVVTTGTTATNTCTFTRVHKWTTANGGPVPMTTTERGGLTPHEGVQIFNLTTKMTETYIDGEWEQTPRFRSDTDTINIITISTLTTEAVTFADPYPTGVIPTVTCTPIGSRRYAYPLNVTNTGFDLVGYNDVSNADLVVNWIAIG